LRKLHNAFIRPAELSVGRILHNRIGDCSFLRKREEGLVRWYGRKKKENVAIYLVEWSDLLDMTKRNDLNA
jgi:hypothetical protein